jgi:hypothetical protein
MFHERTNIEHRGPWEVLISHGQPCRHVSTAGHGIPYGISCTFEATISVLALQITSPPLMSMYHQAIG